LSAKYDYFLKSKYLRENVEFGGSVVGFPAAYPKENLELEAELTVFDGFAGWQKFHAAQLNTQAAELDLNRARLNLDTSVRNNFYQALAAQKLLQVAEQNVKTLEDHLKRAKLTERTGYGTRFDVLRIEATLEEARADQQAAENNVHITRDALSETLGADITDNRIVQGDLPVLNENIVPKDFKLSSSSRDDMEAQFKRDEAARHMASAARADWYPSLSIFADQQFYKFGDFDPAVQPNSDYENAWSVGLRLKWNLLDGGRSYAEQQMRNQQSVETQAQTRAAQLKLPRELDMWKRKYLYSVSLYKARMRALTQFEESVRLATIGIKAGSRTHTELLDAELDLFRARGGVVRAQAEAIEALGKLELAAGKRLWSGSTVP
jgi:outer membrane protein TolC